MSDLNTTISHPLMQSRNGGKIHYASCGNRSRHAGRVRGTENMTHGEVIAKYGTDLCKRCFPEAHAPAVDVEATPAPITKVVTVTDVVAVTEAVTVTESAPAIKVSRAEFIDTLVTVADGKDGGSASMRIAQALGDERVRDLHRFAMNASATYSYMGVSVIDKATAGTMYPVKLAGNGWHTGSLFEVDLATIVWEFLAGLDPKYATR